MLKIYQNSNNYNVIMEYITLTDINISIANTLFCIIINFSK